MARVVLGGFSVDTERDAELIALFEKVKAEGGSQSDLFRSMGCAYLDKRNQLDQVGFQMTVAIGKLSEIQELLMAGAAAQPIVKKNGELSQEKHDKLKGLGMVE